MLCEDFNSSKTIYLLSSEFRRCQKYISLSCRPFKLSFFLKKIPRVLITKIRMVLPNIVPP